MIINEYYDPLPAKPVCPGQPGLTAAKSAVLLSSGRSCGGGNGGSGGNGEHSTPGQPGGNGSNGTPGKPGANGANGANG